MNKLYRRRELRYLMAAAIALAVVTALVWPVRAAPHAQTSYRIDVSAYPDLAGDGPRAPDCLGCDGQFGTGDAIRGRVDPLPSLEVILLDGAGVELQRSTSNPEANGRQRASFTVAQPGDFQVELAAVPTDWELCPGTALRTRIQASDFDLSSRRARVQYGLWHGCQVPTATPTEGIPTAERPTVTPVVTATVVVTPTESVEPTAAPTSPAPTEPAEEPVPQVEALPRPAGLGAILGLVYLDLNEDGWLGPEEPGIPEVGVHLEGGDLSLIQMTTVAGNFEFTGVGPGTYDVFIDVPAGHSVSNTDRYTNVWVDGETVAGVDFGLTRVATPDPQMPPVEPTTGPLLPRTGVAPHSSGRVLLGMAALIGVLGLLGLALESGLARRS